VITNAVEYETAEQEVRDLGRRLDGLQRSHSIGSKGFTKAGIRKMIARIHEELAIFEGSTGEGVMTLFWRRLNRNVRAVNWSGVGPFPAAPPTLG
jgi:hypothetical protein